MSGGIRVDVRIAAPAGCPVAAASEGVDGRVAEVAKTSVRSSDGETVEEFTTDRRLPEEAGDWTAVFDLGSHYRYRFDRAPDGPCACERIEGLGCPVSTIRATDGDLDVVFYAEDSETVREAVTALNDVATDVRIRRLTETAPESSPDFVFVDRDRLTDRQREVLVTAHEMGYFEYPKGANASEVAAELNIAPSTFTEHLSNAQRALFETLIGDGEVEED